MPSDQWTSSLTCAHCGTAYSELEVNLSTKIQDDPMARSLRVGDRVEITRSEIKPSHYLPLQPVGDPLRVLEAWSCVTCGQYRWAEIVIRGDVIEDIHAIKLTPDVIDRAHLIATDELRDVFPIWTSTYLFPDNDWRKPVRADFVEVLRTYLKEHPQ
jgi:hypothetical protein